MAKSKRLVSLDVLRGLTIMLMVTVNSPGSWEHIYPQLSHSVWNGLTLTDMVFPCFLFIMGITTCISMKKTALKFTKEVFYKIVKRTIVLFTIGLLLNWLAAGMPSLSNLRIMGVLQRFALCYLIVSVLALSVPHRVFVPLIATILFFYAAMLSILNGYAMDGSSVLAVVDQRVLGLSHMYVDNGLDPEGILSTLPSVAHVMIGFCVGKLVLRQSDTRDKVLSMFFFGTVMLIVGMLFSDVCPINKKVWSSTYVLVTCGYSLLCFASLAFIIDLKDISNGNTFFLVFGVNPLFCYVLGELVDIGLYSIKLPGGTLQECYYSLWASMVGDNQLASFCFAVTVVALVGFVAWVLYKRHIVVKI